MAIFQNIYTEIFCSFDHNSEVYISNCQVIKNKIMNTGGF